MSPRRKVVTIMTLSAFSWAALTAASILLGYVAGSLVSLSLGWTPPGL